MIGEKRVCFVQWVRLEFGKNFFRIPPDTDTKGIFSFSFIFGLMCSSSKEKTTGRMEYNGSDSYDALSEYKFAKSTKIVFVNRDHSYFTIR